MTISLADKMTAIQQAARFLYIIGESDTGMCKVGISKNANSLGRRLSNLQSGNPRKLSILYTHEYAEDGQAYTMEQSIMRLFSFYTLGLHEEWFNIDYRLIVVQLKGD